MRPIWGAARGLNGPVDAPSVSDAATAVSGRCPGWPLSYRPMKECSGQRTTARVVAAVATVHPGSTGLRHPRGATESRHRALYWRAHRGMTAPLFIFQDRRAKYLLTWAAQPFLI